MLAVGRFPILGRLHLFEIEDQPWCPRVVRDAGTAYLRAIVRVTGQTRRLVPVVARALRRSDTRRIIDLCSGGGGPVPDMVDDLIAQGLDVDVVLTDRYPNQRAMEGAEREDTQRVVYDPKPVDARAVPHDLPGLRTLFNALHHFRPDDARRILADAVEARQPLVACELVRRHPVALIGVLFSPVPVLLLVPFLRPFDWRWLVFTYLLPLIPLLVVWDGLVSCLRVYSPEELRALTEGVDGEKYSWDIEQVDLGPAGVPHAICLIGTPTPTPSMRGSGEA